MAFNHNRAPSVTHPNQNMPQFMIDFGRILETHSSVEELLVLWWFIKPEDQHRKESKSSRGYFILVKKYNLFLLMTFEKLTHHFSPTTSEPNRA